MPSIADAQARQELGELFRDGVRDHEDVMAECLSICRLYNLTPSELFYRYEAFVMSRPSGLRAKLSTISLRSARDMRSELQREQQAKIVASSASAGGSDLTPKPGAGIRRGRGNMGDLGGLLDGLSTPSRPGKAGAGATPRTIGGNRADATPQSSATPGRTSPLPATSSSYRPSHSTLVTHGSTLQVTTPSGKGAANGGSAPSSPVSGPESPGMLTAQPAQPFRLRPQPHTLVETLNPHLPTGRRNVDPPQADPTALADGKLWNYRYMFEKISQRSESLDDMIDEFAESMRDAYALEEFGDPHFVSEEDIFTVGRILAAPNDTAKASTASLYLESSRFLGGGKRISLRFAHGVKTRGGVPGVKSFGLFPGCLVCVKGRNGGGGAFVVDEVLLPPPSSLPTTPAEDLLDHQYGQLMHGEPLSMIVAAGPYTLEADLAYEPLEALLNIAADERPAALLLLGPFVDATHPIISSGAANQSPTDIFRREISGRLARFIERSPNTHVLLVPSVRDLVSRHCAFPQSMLDREALGLPNTKKVKVVPNPTTFFINEISVAVSTVDILFHLRREEVSQRAEEAEPEPELRGAEVKDPMAALTRHVLGQRSFYPIFPPPLAHATEVNLDVTHHSLLRLDDAAPDILILPSKLKHFSKIVDSTLVVNPAFVCRANSAGTFAKILIHPMDKSKLEADAREGKWLEANVWERARSEIWRV